jgi:hypothetical protein
LGQTCGVPQSLAPPPAQSSNRRIVAPSVERVDAELTFDVSARQAAAVATIDFHGGVVSGLPAIDLRQEVEWVRLDGDQLDPADFASRDLGAGPGAEIRVLDVEIEAGARHRLEVGYRLDTPCSEGANPIDWVDGGIRFDLWMSDLHPGRYLEMWVPAPLVHDRFALNVDIRLEHSGRPHTLIANTAGVDSGVGGQGWSVCYPAHFTALSPLLVLAPSDSLEVRRSSLHLPGRDRSLGLITARHVEVDADLAGAEADLRAWLTYAACRYAPWVHGDTFWAVIWASSRGMEYDGATTSSMGALEHEVFHSWFGRGVKPARASDGWIDEAWTVWNTSSRRSELPRFAEEALGLDEPPVVLYPPHPWSRHTAIEAYTQGARLFAGLAVLLGGAGALRAAMADWYRANAGGLVTTDGLAAHLQAWSGRDISPWWARYVHGRS